MPSHRTTLPSYAEVASLLDYEPETGKLRWLVDRGGGVSAGDIAGTTLQPPHNYRLISIHDRLYKAHRICWLLATGKDPGPLEVVHRNGDASDNRLSNLEAISSRLRRLKPKALKSSSSGVPGVSRDARSGKWRARIRMGGKSYSLGMYDSKDDAIRCVEQARSEMIKRVRHGGSS